MSTLNVNVNLNNIQTEDRNPRSVNIDKVPTTELCQIINAEDSTVPQAVQNCISNIAEAIDALTERFQQGGRIFYIGAGTSGRLGVLDASEIPPTYSAPPSQFVGLIAGGDVALRSAIEGAEDSADGAVRDLQALQLNGELDSLIGIAASARTPYVLGGLQYAKGLGCKTVGVACSAPSPMSERGNVDFMISAVTGPEVVTGSTRMKAGTATKLVLNMISTGIMIKSGKTYGNIMIDVKPTNAKLKQRARRILREICGDRCPALDEDLDGILDACDRSVRLAAVVICCGVGRPEAEERLQAAGGLLAGAMKPPDLGTEAGNGIQKHSAEVYFLCVDAGGSKCAASITNANGDVHGHGEAGPCNMTDIGVNAAAFQIKETVKRARDSLPDHARDALDQIGFQSIWIAVAGSERPGQKNAIYETLKNLLPLGTGGSLRVTNDIDLLATSAAHEPEAANVMVLVAGTGSVAMTYSYQNGHLVRTDRSGGWGALLGDDGSGFDIGRVAMQYALQEVEQCRRKSCQTDFNAAPKSFTNVTNVVLKHYNIDSWDLLSSMLSSDSNTDQGAFDAKRRIAACARAVLEIADSDPSARTIVSSAQRSLVGLVRNLSTAAVNTKDSILVLAGGLMESDSFIGGIQDLLKANNIEFRLVIRSERPALVGAKYLAETWARS